MHSKFKKYGLSNYPNLLLEMKFNKTALIKQHPSHFEKILTQVINGSVLKTCASVLFGIQKILYLGNDISHYDLNL